MIDYGKVYVVEASKGQSIESFAKEVYKKRKRVQSNIIAFFNWEKFIIGALDSEEDIASKIYKRMNI